jgi:hypothetical protein
MEKNMKELLMKNLLRGIINEQTELSKDLLNKIEEFGKLSDEIDRAKSEYEKLKVKYRDLETELQPVIKSLEKLDSRTIKANGYLLTIKKLGHEKITFKYAQVLEKVMEMVNSDLKKTIEELLNNTAVISRVSASLGVQRVKEGFIERFAEKFNQIKTRLVNSLKKNLIQIDKLLEILEKIVSKKPY